MVIKAIAGVILTARTNPPPTGLIPTCSKSLWGKDSGEIQMQHASSILVLGPMREGFQNESNAGSRPDTQEPTEWCHVVYSMRRAGP